MEHPLVLYGFTTTKDDKARILNETTSGGVTFNDTILHVAVEDAPFGGVGNAGTGYYHGRYGVLAFSYLRTYVELPTFMDKVMGFRYPPYTDSKTKQMIKAEQAWFDREGTDSKSSSLTVVVGSLVAVLGVVFWKLK